MNRDEPMLFTTILTEKMALEGFHFISSLLGFGSSLDEKHPIYSMFKAAERHAMTSTITWGPSTEFNRLALWGIQLREVQNWPGFERMVARLVNDHPSWFGHLHEASIGALFVWGGCQGEFLPALDEKGPDLKIHSGIQDILVECKRSMLIPSHEQKDFEIWGPASLRIARFLHENVPSAAIRYSSKRSALPGDADFLLQGVKTQIECLFSNLGSHPLSTSPHCRYEPSDKSFSALLIVSDQTDSMFDATHPEKLGVPIPDGIEPMSVIVDLTLGNPPTCDGIWYAVISPQRPWPSVEKDVLNRLDKKAKQLNASFRNIQSDSPLPGVIWIEHPALSSAKPDEMKNLLRRIRGKLDRNEKGHFASVNCVVLSNSRMLLQKNGRVAIQWRIYFEHNPNVFPSDWEDFPFIGWHWYEKALQDQLPWQDVASGQIRLVSAKLSLNSK